MLVQDRASGTRTRALVLGGPLLAVALAGCAPRARMCGEGAACPGASACVAGRCQADGPGLRASIEASRRLVFAPVAMAYVGPGAEPGAAPPHVVTLGGGATLLLRFELPIPEDARVAEAYLVLTRATDALDDPEPISLHATRIVEAWTARSTEASRRPRTEDLGLPVTAARAGGPPLVRLEIGALVRTWMRRDPRDQGVAVVSEGGGPGGMAFATTAVTRRGTTGTTSPAEPYVELYLR